MMKWTIYDRYIDDIKQQDYTKYVHKQSQSMTFPSCHLKNVI